MSGRAVSSGRILKLVGFAAVSVCILVFLVVQNNLRSQLSETQEKLHEIERDNQDLQLKLRDARDTRSMVEAERTKVFQELGQVKSEHGKAVSAMQNELNEMKAKHSRALSDSEESIKEAKDGQSQCEDQKQQMELQNSKHVSILSADLQEEKYKMNECNKSKITVEQRLSQLQANVKANKAKFDNMQKALEDYNSEEASLKERLSAVDKELASLKEQLKSCKESLQARDPNPTKEVTHLSKEGNKSVESKMKGLEEDSRYKSKLLEAQKDDDPQYVNDENLESEGRKDSDLKEFR